MAETGRGLSRRSFIGAAALAGMGAAAGLTACAPKASGGDSGAAGGGSDAEGIPTTWDKEADIVVLGGGVAGLSAAVQASQDGASVIVLEKAAATGGTTALSMAVIHAADTPQQKEFSNSKDDTTDKFEQWLMACGEGCVDPDLVKDFATHAKDHIAELTELGGTFNHLYAPSPVPYVPQDLVAERVHYFSNEKYGDMSGGAQLAMTLLDASEAAGAVVELSTEADHLYLDGTKGVVGVRALQGSTTLTVKANKGVVIATSSFDHNEAMCRAFNPQGLWDLSAPQLLMSAPSDTGDGIRMGMEIGADLAGFIGSLDMSLPLMSGAAGSEGLPQSVIFVNGNGQRFVAEDSTYGYLSRAYFQQETQLGSPCYVITDSTPTVGADGSETTRLGSMLMGTTVDDAVASGQWIKGDTVEELASAIGVKPAALAATVARFNEVIATGEDVDYNRRDASSLGALNVGPFYAARLTSYSLGTNGGLKINVEAQVLDVQGDVIPHLYAAGMACGGWIGPYYPSSGIALMGGLHWGRKAGKNAAAGL